MFRLEALALSLALLAPTLAPAAGVTRVASSFEEDDPFDLLIDVGFERTGRQATLVRERQQDGAVQDISELDYRSSDARLKLDVAVGLYRDLQLTFGVPIVFQRNESWRFAQGTNAANSTIANNCLDADGRPQSECAPLFGVPQDSYRGGLGDMHFGLAYAPFNQKKDDTKPTWVLGFDYQAPTAERLDPTEDTTRSSERGNIGERNHLYTFYTAFSRRIGVVDPYFRAHYTLPYRGPGWYSNCDHPDALPDGGNCFRQGWDRSETGVELPHRAGITFGSEFNVFDEPAKQQGFTLDARLIADYVSEGRYYNPLSAPLRRLLWTQDYAELGGRFGVVARAGDVLSFAASTTLLWVTDHDLTDESIGTDFDGNGTVDLGSTEAGFDPKHERNPNFDFRTDLVSRRFRETESSVFRFDLTATFRF